MAVGCDSIRAIIRLLQRSPPRAIVMRQSCRDGFSDQVLAQLAAHPAEPPIRRIVLVAAGTPAAQEARQINLGADCVLRDPIRTELLLAYLDRYQRAPPRAPAWCLATPDTPLAFAGGRLQCARRLLRNGRRTTPLTPREVELAEILAGAPGRVVSYETLYSDILGRPFRGDTSNMRVLLGKLTASAAAIGLAVRDWIEVIPKAGYRHRQSPPSTRPARRPQAGGLAPG